MEKNIYNMELHEEANTSSNVFITRVAGGWIYAFYENDSTSSVFVSFNNEFQKQD